ncbi:MAG TPA: MFS transporter [Acidimicrobiales bacterium]|nr:MFS transporter [Acidimicrobiales bacterium]
MPLHDDRSGSLVPGVTERRLQVAAVGVALMGALPAFMTGALAVQIGRDIELGPTRLGVATGAFFGAAAMTSALMGRLAERVGPGRAMRSAAIASAVLQLSLALSPAYSALLAALLVAGPANSLAQVGANLLLAKAIRPERQGWALAVKQAGMPGATLLGGLAVPALAVTVGWRWAFAAGALGALAAAAIVPVGAVAAGGRRPAGRRVDVPLGPLVLLAAAVGFASAANGTLATFVVSAGVDSGLGESAAGLVLTLGSAAGITMRLVVGARADRRGGRHLPVVSLLLAGGAAGYLLLAPGTVPTHLVGSLVAFGFGWAWPGLFNLAVVRLNPTAPAAATGITQTGVYVGALTGPILFGAVVDAAGYGLAWLLAGLASGAAAVGVSVGRRRVVAWRDAAAAPGAAAGAQG